VYNIIILGSGRSGTSMVAGSLKDYFYGDKLIPPREANPKGFFESPVINLDINEGILNLSTNDSKVLAGRWWLSVFPYTLPLISSLQQRRLIRKYTKNVPYCFKDPRFCYTLPIWRPFLADNTRFICVFRHPYPTMISIRKECQTALYLKDFNPTGDYLYDLWYQMYYHILNRHMKKGEWFFIHYDQMFFDKKLDELEEFIGTEIDRSFPERRLIRSYSLVDLPVEINHMYKTLCELSSYETNTSS